MLIHSLKTWQMRGYCAECHEETYEA
jgi:hypothetical protein